MASACVAGIDLPRMDGDGAGGPEVPRSLSAIPESFEEWIMPAKALRIPAILLLGSCALCLTPIALGQVETPSEDAVPEGLSKGEWTGIRAAHEAGRHAAYPVASVLEAATRASAGACASTGAVF